MNSSVNLPTFTYNYETVKILPGNLFSKRELMSRLHQMDVDTTNIPDEKTPLVNLYNSAIFQDENKIKIFDRLTKDSINQTQIGKQSQRESLQTMQPSNMNTIPNNTKKMVMSMSNNVRPYTQINNINNNNVNDNNIREINLVLKGSNKSTGDEFKNNNLSSLNPKRVILRKSGIGVGTSINLENNNDNVKNTNIRMNDSSVIRNSMQYNNNDNNKQYTNSGNFQNNTNISINNNNYTNPFNKSTNQFDNQNQNNQNELVNNDLNNMKNMKNSINMSRNTQYDNNEKINTNVANDMRNTNINNYQVPPQQYQTYGQSQRNNLNNNSNMEMDNEYQNQNQMVVETKEEENGGYAQNQYQKDERIREPDEESTFSIISTFKNSPIYKNRKEICFYSSIALIVLCVALGIVLLIQHIFGTVGNFFSEFIQLLSDPHRLFVDGIFGFISSAFFGSVRYFYITIPLILLIIFLVIYFMKYRVRKICEEIFQKIRRDLENSVNPDNNNNNTTVIQNTSSVFDGCFICEEDIYKNYGQSYGISKEEFEKKYMSILRKMRRKSKDIKIGSQRVNDHDVTYWFLSGN